MAAYDHIGFHFLQTEVNTGLMFTWIALSSGKLGRPEKVDRNRAHARTAYDTIIRFRDQVPLTQSQAAEIESGFERLRKRLVELGEPL